ncbi:MAG: DNA modification methylase [Promethearchaeota archaeon]
MGGNQRLKVLKELYNDDYEVEVVIVDLDEQQEKALNLALNKISGDWDIEKLIHIFEELDKDLLDLTGFDEDEIVKINEDYDLILLNASETKEDNFNIDETKLTNKYDVKSGDIWQLGEHRLMCGDATKKEDVEKLMNGKKADMVFTDPPYDFENFSFFNNALNYSTENAELFIFYSDKLGIKLASKFFDYFIRTFIVKFQTGVLISNNQPMQAHDLIFHFRKNKNNFKNLNDGFSTYLGEINKNFIRQNEFRYEKSIEILSKIILHYTNNSNIVLDLFGGSGSTLIACEQLNRKCYMMEIDPIYCSVIIERWEKFTGNKAVKL